MSCCQSRCSLSDDTCVYSVCSGKVFEWRQFTGVKDSNIPTFLFYASDSLISVDVFGHGSGLLNKAIHSNWWKTISVLPSWLSLY
ncbi:MAG: hypothetical protein IPK73_23745 [Candidatus Obscuribacter sp.]|nr:hypothetical protein [Candidatus Obscuribacter sp.]